MDRLGIIALTGATIGLYWIVPGLPFAHLDNPGHWGVLGYFLTLVIIMRQRVPGSRGRALQRWMVVFLCSMPLIYIAYWLRYGGSQNWLGIELVGLLIYWGLAWMAVAKSPRYLALGIGLHALWDIAHYSRTEFVDDWYTLACLLVDVALAIYIAGQVPQWLETRPLQYRRL